MIILPNKDDGLSALESKVNEIKFDELSRKVVFSNVILEIPKFKIEFEINMNEPLKKVSFNLIKFVYANNLIM